MAKQHTTKVDSTLSTIEGATDRAPKGKLGTLAALLHSPDGATLAQLAEATGWQPHSVRGAMAGALRKKHGLIITSEKVEGTRVYRVTSGEKA